ncbi:MAG: hypothetical protein K8S24_11775 [Candidatus Aegiribacteria sp.]|nr:hypothetical protein [Candidatus Aegiribacteria sp.]
MFRIFVGVVAVSLMFLIGCGGGDQPQTDDTTGDVISEEAADEAVDEEIIEESSLYPEGKLDPATVTPDVAVGTWALNEAYFAWIGKEVTLVAYPYIWYGEDVVVEDDLRLVADPESTDELATANFDEPLNLTVMRGEIIAVRGIVEDGWNGPELAGAVFVDAPDAFVRVETSPWAYAGEPIPVDQFNEMFNVWTGKEVTVEGHYHSSTTSTTDYGVTIRIDLSHPEDTYTKLVACEMLEPLSDLSDSLIVAERSGVQIRGTVGDPFFDQVGLEGCILLNR